MARSYHVTVREWTAEFEADYASAEARRERLQVLSRQLAKKSVVKRQVRAERTPVPPPPSTPGPIEAIPIEVVDRDLHLFYPASPDDLRDVIRVLPAGVLDGLDAVRLLLGTEQQLAVLRRFPGASVQLDPWFERPGMELVPGIFTPPLRGFCTHSDPATIELYAATCASPLEEASPVATLLRLRFLATFVHEVAHHDDWRRRVARGRWRMLDQDRNEQYAVATAASWMRSTVLPFLRARDPGAIERIEAWIEAEVGVRLPLDLFVGDWIWDDRGRALPPSRTSVQAEFDDLLRARSAGKGLLEARLEFASRIQAEPFEDESISVLEAILRGNPTHADAHALIARAHLSRGRVGDCRAWAARAIELDPGCERAWRMLGTARQRSGDWPGAIDAYDRALAIPAEGDINRGPLRVDAIRGRIETGRIDEAWALLPLLESEPGSGAGPRPSARALRALLLLRGGDFAAAFQLAEDGTGMAGIPNRLRLGVRIEAGIRQGRSTEIGLVPKELLPGLRFIGHGAWADRLEALLAEAGFQRRRDGAWRPPGRR